jgi:diaminopimelate decarboxylase
LRINPNIDADTHHYVTTGRSFNKFGMPQAKGLELARSTLSMKQVGIAGVHYHIGSQMTSVRPLRLTARYACQSVREFRKLGIEPEFINLGGGIGMSYDAKRVPVPAQFASAIFKELAGESLKLYLEPGRYISGPSALLLTSVVFRKTNRGNVFLVVDAGMNDLIRPALYQAYHHAVAVKKSRAGQEKASVVGPICESADVLAKGRKLPKLIRGDLLALTGAGAYSASMGSNYNARQKPAEVLVSGRTSKLIRRRESYKDLIRLEQ